MLSPDISGRSRFVRARPNRSIEKSGKSLTDLFSSKGVSSVLTDLNKGDDEERKEGMSSATGSTLTF